jgi:DNA-binding XRE family transcriptional regulator
MTTADLLSKAQTIRTPNGEEMVVIPKAIFEELRLAYAEAEEDAEDVAIYDARKADALGSVPMPAEVTMALMKGDRRIRAIRNWKKITQQRLARDAGITQGHLSDLETGRRAVTAETARAIAKAMSVPVGWIGD